MVEMYKCDYCGKVGTKEEIEACEKAHEAEETQMAEWEKDFEVIQEKFEEAKENLKCALKEYTECRKNYEAKKCSKPFVHFDKDEEKFYLNGKPVTKEEFKEISKNFNNLGRDFGDLGSSMSGLFQKFFY